MKKVNNMTVFEPTDKCSLDEYSQKAAIEVPELIKKAKEEVNQKVIEISENDIKQDNEIAILKTNYTNLQEQNTKLEEKIKKDRKNMINLETEGQSIHIEDSSDLEGQLEVLGNVEQETNLYTGKLEQGTITKEGEVLTANRVRTADFIKVTAGIKIPVRATGADKFAFATYDNNKKFTSIIGTWTNVGESIAIPSNVNYIKIILGKNDDSNIAVSDIINFVVGNLPSPEYPSEIRAVGDNVNLLNWGENIIKNIAWKDTGESYTAENTNGTPDFIKIINTITISYNGKVAHGNLGRFNTYDKDKKIVATELITKLPYTKKFNSNEKYYTFHLVSPYVTYGSELKLELGEVPTSYSPYGQGSVEIKKQNKNLLKNTAKTQTVNGVTFTVNEDGTVIANGTSTNVSYIDVNTFPFIKNNDYILSGCPDGGSDNSYKMYCLNISSGAGLTNDYGNGGVIKVGTNQTGTIRIRIANGYKANNLIFKPKLEKGIILTEYKQHQEQTYILPIQRPILEGDYFVKEADGWKEVHTWKEFTLNGKEDWKQSSVENTVFFLNITNTTQDRTKFKIIANSYKYGGIILESSKAQDGYIYGFVSNSILAKRILLRNNLYTNLESFKKALENNVLEVYAKAEMSTKLPCTPEQTKILDELDNFSTYKLVTNVATDSIAKLKLKYIADTKTYIDNKTSNLEQQVNTINQLLSTTRTSSVLLDNLQTDIEREVL